MLIYINRVILRLQQLNRFTSQVQKGLSSMKILLCILAYLIGLGHFFPLTIELGDYTINAVTSYKFSFNFSASVPRSQIKIVLPSLSNFTAITLEENGANLTNLNYTILGNTITRISPPTRTNFIYIIYGVQNSAHSVQVSDGNVITNISGQVYDTIPYVTFTQGMLQSCIWTFGKFTGSSNSTADIRLVLGNSLNSPNISFYIDFIVYPDGINQFLTISSSPTAQYSLTGDPLSLTPVTGLLVNGFRISFNVNKTGSLIKGTTILIRLSGIQNPPTQTTASSVFTVSTYEFYDSNFIIVDQSNGCTVQTLSLQSYSAVFDRNNALPINFNYPGPRATISTTVPFIILMNDTLKMEYSSDLIYASSLPLLTIQYTRGNTLIFNQINNGTIGTKFFNATSTNTFTTQPSSVLVFAFNITTPHSQTPWTFTFTFGRPSGGYFQVISTLVSIPGTFSANSVNFTAPTYQMAVQTSYTAVIMLGQPITGAGKVSMTFPSDFGFGSFSDSSCTGKINNTGITSSTSGCYIQNGSSYTVVFQLGGVASTTISSGSTITVFINNIINPLSPKNYSFSATSYYNLQNDSVTQSGVNLQSQSYTVHFVNPSISPNIFSVYQKAQFSIIYKNDVPWPKNSTVNISFPLEVYQWEFGNQILVNTSPESVTLPKTVYNSTQKWISFNTPDNISSGSDIQIPFNITTPAITGNYPYIAITVTYNSVLYEQCLTGANMEMYVTSPSSDANVSLYPYNLQVGAISKYQLLINSNVPHPSSFDIIITLPSSITYFDSYLGVNSSCQAIGSTCASNIQPILLTRINVSITNNNWSSLNPPYQTFSLNISFFKNQRSLHPTDNWNVQTQKYLNGAYQSIIKDTCTSSVTVPSKLTAALVSPADYYRSNPSLVGIKVALSSPPQTGDYLLLYFNIQQTYALNSPVTLSCPAPLGTFCTISSSTISTFYLKVLLPSGLGSSFQLDIIGLISYSNSVYNVTKYIQAIRYDINSKQIDNGQIAYAIGCGNASIASLQCRTCFANNTCGSCYSGYFLLKGVCVTNCSVLSNYSTYQNQSTNKCDPCIYPCLTCSSDTSCLSCSLDKAYFLLSDYTCALTCNTSNGYWIKDFDGQSLCVACFQNCLSCKNSSNSGCTKCKANYYLYNGNCNLDKCPLSGQYFDDTKTCFNCDTTCLTCSNSGPNNCIDCKPGFKNSSGACLSSCPSTLFTFPNNTCGCQAKCATCLSTSSTFCTACTSSGGISKKAFKGACYQICPTQAYDFGNGSCASCTTNCVNCTSNTSCSLCKTNNYLYSNLCYSDCNLISDQFDISQDKKSCYKCPAGCDTCTLTSCSTCLSGYTLLDNSCTLSCSLTSSCAVPNQVPDSILPLPGTLSVFIWIGIVVAMKVIVGKLYVPYSMVFMLSLIQYFLIIVTAIYANDLSAVVARLLATDYSYRSTIFALLIVALVLNYLTNILFLIIFFLYIKPLIASPRQIDVITNGVVLVIGTLTNYRFCLLIFSKMFPKPQIPIQNSSKLTPVHYLCMTSAVLSVFALAGSGIILKNQFPLTDIFMLGVDLIIIQMLLFSCSIWMVAIDKDQDYYNNDVKKYNLEEMYRTEQGILEDQKNISKANIRNQNDFEYLKDSIRFDKHINNDRLSAVNLQIQQVPSSDVENNPLPKVSKMNNVNLEALRIKPKNNRDQQQDLDITHIQQSNIHLGDTLQNKQKVGTRRKHSKMMEDKDNGLRSKSKETPLNFGKDRNKYKSPQKKLENNQKQSGIQIDDFSSGQIPNLPLNQSVFHKKTSHQFGSKLPKPKQNSHRSTMIQKKKNNFDNMSQKKVDMKKKNKLFQSDAGQSNVQQMDIDAIIQSKIVMNRSQKLQNVSSIQKKQEQASQGFNQQISPSWFNIQNQRYQFSQNDSDNP